MSFLKKINDNLALRARSLFFKKPSELLEYSLKILTFTDSTFFNKTGETFTTKGTRLIYAFHAPGIPSLQSCNSSSHSSISVNIEQEYKKGGRKTILRSTENNSQSIVILWVCPRVCFDVVFSCIVGHYRFFNSSVAIFTLTSPIDILNVPTRSALVLLTKAGSSFVPLAVCKQWCFLLTFESSHRSVGKNSSPRRPHNAVQNNPDPVPREISLKMANLWPWLTD